MSPKTDAEATGAEFEENTPSAEVVVNSRQRATRPEYTGEKEADDLEASKEEAPKAKPSKSGTLQPDVAEKDLAEAGEVSDEPEQDDQATISELAKAAVDKKTEKDAEADSAQQQNIQNLIDNKTYFVPVGQGAKKRATKAVLGVVLVLIILGTIAFIVMTV